LSRNSNGEHSLEAMNIIDPSSLIRKKGNLKITLTVDLPLQKELEKLVSSRGYGKDTSIVTDTRVGSFGEFIEQKKVPRDTLRRIRVVQTDTG